MTYSDEQTGNDKIGGIPAHLPINWPYCQCCQEPMQFLGQFYESDFLPLQGNLAIQFYRCEDNGRPHIELIPKYAAKNTANIGVKCNDLAESFISYTPVEDPVDQKTYMSDIGEYAHFYEECIHLRSEKIGGLFPNDGCEDPLIDDNHHALAKFHFNLFAGFVYLFKDDLGFYLVGPL